MFIDREKGSALVMTLMFSIMFAGLAGFLLVRVQSEAKTQGAMNNRVKALRAAFSGLNIAMVRIGDSDYNAGPDANRNALLYNADGSEDGQPGNLIVDEEIYSVRVNNLGNYWFELTSISTEGEDTREVKLRVRERDYFSRFSLFAENGNVVVDDTNRWYGDVHVNNYLMFRNRLLDTYAKFYGKVTSTKTPMDYA